MWEGKTLEIHSHGQWALRVHSTMSKAREAYFAAFLGKR